MKALVLRDYNRFEYADVPDVAPDEGQVRVDVRACGICGSDVHGMDGSTGRRLPPVIMGHEASGVIGAVGGGVAEWRVGDRVTFDSTIYCGQCAFCHAGRVNLCDERRVLGVSCEEYRCDGALADAVVVPQRILHRLPDDLSFVHAALVEPLSVAVHAVARIGDVPGSAVVIGAGMIGLLVVQVLYARGVESIIAVDLDEQRLDLAGRLGATTCLNAETCDVPAEVRNRTAGIGVDAAFEVVGASTTLSLAVEALRKGGTLAMVGNVSPTAELPLQSAVTRELTLVGSCASAGEYPACLAMLAAGEIDADAMIGAVAPLADGADWFRRLQEGERLMKVILTP
jgi:L-iditol 2-dehydrogenase